VHFSWLPGHKLSKKLQISPGERYLWARVSLSHLLFCGAGRKFSLRNHLHTFHLDLESLMRIWPDAFSFIICKNNELASSSLGLFRWHDVCISSYQKIKKRRNPE